MAENLARSSGTPEDVLQRVLGQEFLMKCLRKAKFSPDLLQDTADACEINDLNALVLGSGLLTVSEASEKLFLMQDEASTVVSVCRKECLRAGVNFGDGAQLTAEELAEKDEDEPAAPAPPPPAPTPSPAPAAPALPPAPTSAPTMPAVQIPPAPFNAPASRFSPGSHDSKTQKQTKVVTGVVHASVSTIAAGPVPTMSGPIAPAPSLLSPKPSAAASPKEDVSSRRLGMAPALSVDHPDPNFLIKPPVGASAQGAASTGSTASGTPTASRSHIPRPSSATPATPAAGVATPRDRAAARPMTRASPLASSFATPPTSSGGASDPGSRPINTPAMNGRLTPAASSSAAKPPRPSSAPLTARASTTAPLGKDRPSTAVTPPVQPSKLPSYAKPTAAHKARLLKEDSDLPSTSSAPTPPITFASTNKPLRRIQYMAPRAASSPEEKKEPKKPVFDNIRSNLLRPTAAFLAWTAGKSKSTKESDLRSSQSLTGEASGPVGRARAPNSAPPKGAAIREFSATTVSALSPSLTLQGSAKIATTPEPFRLASAERHQKAQEELARKKEEKARLESQIPKFKASPMPNSVERLGPSGSKTEAKRASIAQTDA